jgi:imidazole glycerol phosphate synthase glutamine amidotransferase subunit
VSASIVVLDYEMSNLRSAVKALERLGASVRVARSGDEVGRSAAIVLPGVGHFGEAMRRIDAAGFVPAVREAAGDGAAVLGICLGLQLLFEGSEESPGVAGIGLLPGRSRRLVTDRKLPQIGWNVVEWAEGAPLAPAGGDAHGRTYYFVHSYAVEPEDPAVVMGLADYGGPFCAAAGAGRVMGVQFHPEKSSDAGLGLLARWLERVAATAPVA